MLRTKLSLPAAARVTSGALIVVATLLLASACAETPAPATPADEPAAQESPEEVQPTPEETETPAPVAVLTHAWSDSDGYSFSLTIDSATTTATTDVANAKPGEADISFSSNSSGTVTNATPSRNAEAPRSMYLIPVWPADSTVCKYLFDAAGEDWCSFSTPNTTGIMMFPESVTLDEGGSTTVAATQMAPIEFTVEEADADAVVAELNTPGGWMLTLMDTTAPLGSCTAYWNSRDVAASTVALACAQ